MTILTDFLVDRIYPIAPRQVDPKQGGTGLSESRPAGMEQTRGPVEVLAQARNQPIATRRVLPTGGSLTVLGFRPRDDQAASLGYEARWWFEILSKLGAYPATGRFAGINDNTEYLSRTTGYLVCRFPNGAVALAPHLRDLDECWPGGFARDAEQDKAIIAKLKLPSEQISLKDFKVNGHTVTYEGQHTVAFRPDADGVPIAFCGTGCAQITIDGRTTQFADQPMGLIAWAPIDPPRRIENGAVMQIYAAGSGDVHIPAPALTAPIDLIQEGPTPGSRGQTIPSRVEKGVLTFTATPSTGKGLYVVPHKSAS